MLYLTVDKVEESLVALAVHDLLYLAHLTATEQLQQEDLVVVAQLLVVLRLRDAFEDLNDLVNVRVCRYKEKEKKSRLDREKLRF